MMPTANDQQLMLDLGSNPDFLLELFDQPISFNRVLKGIAGTTDAALLLSSLMAMTEMNSAATCWITLDTALLNQETALSPGEQQTAINELVTLGLVKVDKDRRGERLQICMQILQQRLSDYAEDLRRSPSPQNKVRSH
jgi:hypothetical protein